MMLCNMDAMTSFGAILLREKNLITWLFLPTKRQMKCHIFTTLATNSLKKHFPTSSMTKMACGLERELQKRCTSFFPNHSK